MENENLTLREKEIMIELIKNEKDRKNNKL